MNTALLIDGGHTRSCFTKAKVPYTKENISNFCSSCFSKTETIYRIFYYDAPHFEGEQKKPVSGDVVEYKNKDKLLSELGGLENFAIRKGRLKWGGWKIRPKILSKITQGSFKGALQDKHFIPNFEQKGVDMVLGLDVAMLANTGKVDQFMIATADTDMVPAFKHGRVRGMKSVLIKPEFERSYRVHAILREHADIVREVDVS